jgi:hypothetical protein
VESDAAVVPRFDAAKGIVPGASGSWWRTAIVYLGCSLVCVMLWIVARQSNGDWFYSRPAITVRGDAFQLVRGSGRLAQSSFVIDPLADGVTAISTGVAPFQADRYTRVELLLRSAQFPTEGSFAWRRLETGSRNFSQPLQRLTEGFAPLNLVANPDWRGTITGIAVIVRGPAVAPVEIAGVRLSSGSALSTARATLAEWAAFIPLKGYSIAFPFDGERSAYMALVKAVAIAIGIAIVLYLFISRRRGRPADARVLWAIFAGSWLLLDLRWQANVFRQVAITAERFAGKTSEEKLLTGEGPELVALVRETKDLLPPPPARVLFLCDAYVISLRGAYLLYPYNTFHSTQAPKSKGGVTVPDYRALRSGDYVLLYFYSGLGYDFATQQLIWRDGHTVPADLLLSKPNTLLLRVR